MTISLENQVAVVTGAGRGLGRAYALELARLGASVVVNDPGVAMDGSEGSSKPADEVCEEIRAAGGQAIANHDSVARFDGGAAIVQTALDQWGRLDAVVCNAGILRDRAFHKMSEDDWDSVMGVHIKGCFNVLRNAWPTFREQRYGRVVMITSTTGLFGNFGQSNYGAAKAAMIGFMNTLKLEGQKYDIRVNLVAPSATTRMTEDLMPAEIVASLGPEHVAPVVGLLCSRECPDTGLVIEALAGRVARSAIVRGKGITYEVKEPVDADWVLANWKQITSLDDAALWWHLQQPLEES
jgi:NAD(P)-dependent dehydrogenase (short-subunit alcohol dehydrogenase family)